METKVHPLNCKFSSVGSFDSINRQNIKEWDGGMQGRHISVAQSRFGGAGLRNWKASFEESSPLGE